MLATIELMEAAGVLAIIIGILVASWNAVRNRHSRKTGAFQSYRSAVGRSVLLGLEFLLAADIIRSVTIERTLESLVVLGGIVLIRTFLSISLEVELQGRWPWQGRAGSERS